MKRATPTVAGGLAASIAAAARQHGLKDAQIEGALGVRLALLPHAHSRVPIDGVRRLLELLVRVHVRAPLIAASGSTCGNLGLAGLLLLTATSAGHWLAGLSRNGVLISEWGRWSFVRAAEGTWLVFDAKEDAAIDRVLVEMAVVSCVASVRDAFPDCRPERVCFRHAAAADSAFLVDFFACPLELAAARNGVLLSADFPDLAPRLANEELFGYLKLQAEQAVRLLAQPDDLIARLRAELVPAIASKEFSSAVVARRLGLSERTLRRRLAEAGFRFRDLVEEARLALGEQLIAEPSRTIAEAASNAGYAETSGFSRAFRRRRGAPPSAWGGRGQGA